MKSSHIVIKSKDQGSINNFKIVFFYYLLRLKLNYYPKEFESKTKRTVLTILKSPHVNKIAQEQFEILYFIKKLSLYQFHKFKILFLLKKMKLESFAEVNLKTRFTVNLLNDCKLRLKVFDLDNYYINPFEICLKKQFRGLRVMKSLKKNASSCEFFLYLLDIYGEVNAFLRLV